MSQHDFNIDNQSAPAFRGDLNNALEALGTLSSGPTAPATTYANMQWYDTANNILKMRSEADDAWIDIGTLDQSTNTFAPAGVAELSQAEAEDDTSTVFGKVSGQRLAQAVAANTSGLGVGQTWQDVSASRAINTSYQNTTGKPIFVSVSGYGSAGAAAMAQVSVNGSTWVSVVWRSDAAVNTASFVVPDNWYYKIINLIAVSGGWAELR